MADYSGTVYANRDYTVVADDEEQAKEFIYDLADEDFPQADVIVVKDIYEVSKSG